MQTKSEMINRIAELAKKNAELKAENERLKHLDEEINDFISDISTCGFKYDDRCPDNLDELQCCIEDLCNKFSNYKQTLQEIKAIAETCCSEINCEECPFTDECNTEMEALGVCRMILKSISKAEEE